MPDIFYLISRWWKQILVIMILSMLTVGAVLFYLPSKYLSTTTAVPASTYLKDKGSIFNNNIQQLYPTLGLPDDLDMIVGTGQLDTPFIAVTKQFNLYDHYKTEEQGDAAISKAAYLLKKNSQVYKSDYGELKVKVWDTDKDLAPQLANALMEELNRIHRDIQNSNNISIFQNLQTGKQNALTRIKQLDEGKDSARSANESILNDRAGSRATLSAQVQQYDRLIGEYQLMVDSKSPALITVEKARSSNWPDKPKKALWLTASLFLSFLFALFVALLLDKKKHSKL